MVVVHDVNDEVLVLRLLQLSLQPRTLKLAIECDDDPCMDESFSFRTDTGDEKNDLDRSDVDCDEDEDGEDNEACDELIFRTMITDDTSRMSENQLGEEMMIVAGCFVYFIRKMSNTACLLAG